MSAPEHPRQAPEGLSSVKLVRNASGKTQIELKVYATSNEPEDLDAAQREAERRYEELCSKFPIGGAA